MCGFVICEGLFFHHVLVGDWGNYCCTKLIDPIFCYANSGLGKELSSVYIAHMLLRLDPYYHNLQILNTNINERSQ